MTARRKTIFGGLQKESTKSFTEKIFDMSWWSVFTLLAPFRVWDKFSVIDNQQSRHHVESIIPFNKQRKLLEARTR